MSKRFEYVLRNQQIPSKYYTGLTWRHASRSTMQGAASIRRSIGRGLLTL
jgi:hypothetical protein